MLPNRQNISLNRYAHSVRDAVYIYELMHLDLELF